MGTNYYATEPPCPAPCTHCTQTDWHIGKSLVAFQGYDQTPWGPIRAWRDWRDILRKLDQRPIVTDECGRTYAAEEFIALVEATKPAERRRQYEWVVENGRASTADWLDCDQFSFTSSDFT